MFMLNKILAITIEKPIQPNENVETKQQQTLPQAQQQQMQQVSSLERQSPKMQTPKQLQQNFLQSQVQQGKPKKVFHTQGVPAVIQPHQFIIPQKTELSSPPSLSARLTHSKKREPESESSPAPVFIVQKIETPILVRQPQSKFRYIFCINKLIVLLNKTILALVNTFPSTLPSLHL